MKKCLLTLLVLSLVALCGCNEESAPLQPDPPATNSPGAPAG